MEQFIDPLQLKSKRNYSNIGGNYANSLPLYQHNPRKNPIKVNKNKLPSDWFPRSESSNKKINLAKINFKQLEGNNGSTRKAQSQKRSNSPQKPSFFNFFQEPNKNFVHARILNRKFQTRQIIKRQPILDVRHFTPITNTQKNDILDLFPSTYDSNIGEILLNTKINKNSKNIRKQIVSKYRQYHNPQQKDGIQSHRKNYIEMEVKDNDPNNITFFNAKSTSFPPVVSKNINKN